MQRPTRYRVVVLTSWAHSMSVGHSEMKNVKMKNDKSELTIDEGNSHKDSLHDQRPPVMSLALNLGGCAGPLVSETYCMRKSARMPSNI